MVEMVSVSGVEPLLAGVAGLKLQVAPCGRPEQRSAMVSATVLAIILHPSQPRLCDGELVCAKVDAIIAGA